MAGPRSRRSRAAGHDTDRDRDERAAPSGASALDIAFRTLQPDADLRRSIAKRLEPAEGAGAAIAIESTERPAAADRGGFQSRRANLLVHGARHQSQVRLDGPENH